MTPVSAALAGMPISSMVCMNWLLLSTRETSDRRRRTVARSDTSSRRWCTSGGTHQAVERGHTREYAGQLEDAGRPHIGDQQRADRHAGDHAALEAEDDDA